MARRRWWAVAAAVLAVTAACTTADTRGSDSNDLGDPGSCTVVDMAVSPEKIDLILALAKSFNGTKQAKADGTCVFVRPQKKPSGAAAQLLYTNWDETANGPKPVVWSPAAASWGQMADQRVGDQAVGPRRGAR